MTDNAFRFLRSGNSASVLSKTMPRHVGLIYIIGIGGIGMSAIAEILHSLGYQVAGSDLSDNPNVARLRSLGIDVKIGQVAENITNDIAVVVRSTAVKDHNPEVQGARALRIPVLGRAEMLAEITRLKTSISISGTHGKTTTTALVGAMLEAGGLEPTVINGGIINAHKTNAVLGKGDWLVVEADESDGTFTKLFSSIGIVTNIEPEHLDYYGSFDAARQAFRSFIQNLPFYGLAILCNDDPEVRSLIEKVSDRTIITYGLNEPGDLNAVNVRIQKDGSLYDVNVSANVAQDGKPFTINDIFLPAAGLHNVQNSLAAIAVGLCLSFSADTIRAGLANFSGVKRRFTKTGEVAGVTIIDDYGHHPTEIRATLKAARGRADAAGGRVIAVAQPHRFSRVRDLFSEFCNCFNDADAVIISDIYTAGETPIDGITRDALVEGIINAGHKNVQALSAPEALAAMVQEIAKPNDYVILLGAGSVTHWAQQLPLELEKLQAVPAHMKEAVGG